MIRPEIIGYPVLGSSWTIESVRPRCACGRVLGMLEYKIATKKASGEWNSFPEIANALKLKLCCRNEFLSRRHLSIVSNDIATHYVESKLQITSAAEVRNGPEPKTLRKDVEELCLPELL